MMQIAPEQGAFMTMLTQLRRRPPRGRGRDVHRVLGAVHRPRAARRRPPALLRRQRGVDRRSVASTGSRPASPTGSSCASRPRSRRCARCRTSETDRPRVRRRRQAELRRLLRGARSPRLRPGGVILVDNVLWGGSVVDDAAQRREPGRDPRVQRHGRGRRPGRDRDAPARRRPHPRSASADSGLSVRTSRCGRSGSTPGTSC